MIFICMAIALFATICGSLTGIGGGVIIKPVLDVTGSFDAVSIGLMSAFTIFTMACTSVTRRAISHNTPFKKITITLGIGSVCGGILGDRLFNFCVNSMESKSMLTSVQNIALVVCLIFVVFYMNVLRKKGKCFHMQSSVWGLGIGLLLGGISTFIGIGGGPINVAVLCLLLSLDMKEASFNSLIMIIFSQGAKIIKAVLFSREQITSSRGEIVVAMCVCAVAGGLIGTALNKKVNNSSILVCYNILMVMIIALGIYNAVGNILIGA